MVPRVYASVDLRACGRDRSMPCGVAVLDPVAGGLAADPAGELPYQLPFQVDGEVVSLAVSGPPKVSDRPGYLQLAPASGRRWTQSIGAISSSVGRIYIADLSHFALANDVSTLVGSSPHPGHLGLLGRPQPDLQHRRALAVADPHRPGGGLAALHRHLRRLRART